MSGTGWLDFANALAKYDTKHAARVSEDIVTHMVWVSLAYVVGLSEAIGIPRQEGGWNRGSHGQGDVVSEDGSWHVEIKGARANVSWGAKCPNACGRFQSQFAHMAETGAIIVIAHSGRIPRLERELTAENLSIRILSIAAFASELTAILLTRGEPPQNPWDCLFDVELNG